MKSTPLSKISIQSLALILVVALTTGVLTMRFTSNRAFAYLDNVKDLLSASAPGSVATHTISYIDPSVIDQNETIKITFDPETDLFDGIADLTTGDVQFSGATLVPGCGGGPDEITLSTSTGAGDESVIFTVCPGDAIASGTKNIVLGGGKITNPTSTGSYVVRIHGTQPNNGDTRVAIIDDVTVTASVDTNFTFSISPVASGTDINGATTTFDSATTSMNFGTLTVGTPVTLGQELRVITNAKNGFAIRVREDQNLTNTSGDDIDLFSNGSATSTPSPWTGPANNVDDENTFGHFGVTSNDSDLNGGEFAGGLFAGNFQATSSRVVFSHTGPADGSTPDKGLASVAFRIQIGVLQQPGTDYTNTLTYIATPSF